MNKKFASLGTVLSREQAKKVVGGLVDELSFDDGDDSKCAGSCNKDSDCAKKGKKCGCYTEDGGSGTCMS